jgi:serine/threonine-protein kinase
VTTEALEDPLIGQTLSGRFRILEPLGSGGMGKVYKAMQSPLDRIVALKVLNPRYAGEKDPGFERRFFLEAAMTAKLHHPNTITVHDYGRTDDGMLFIAMEYVEGETLQQLLNKDKALPWVRALNIAGQICRSLREAHKLGVIHRDLKPANVMVLHEETGSDLVKVLDFGLVKPFMPDAAMPQAGPELTQAGVLLGSPLYMAPESAKNEHDPRSDIYSLGVLLFQVITGRPPFTGKDSIDIIVKHIREEPPRLKSLKPDVPDEVEVLVMRCLEKEPRARYQTMDEVLEGLKWVASQTGLSGAFSDPRAAVVGSASAGASSQPVPRISNPGGPRRGTPLRSVEIPLETDAITAPNRNPLWVYTGGALAAALLVTGGAVLASRVKPKVLPAPPKPAMVKPKQPDMAVKPPEPPQPEPPKPVAMVTFAVSSAPPGATVTMNGQTVGVTPFSLPLKGDDDESAKALLTFALDGYQSVTVSAEGKGTVNVAQTLKKKVAVKKMNPKDEHSPGYKDDPY